jgi:hyperosmotically inducible protein
MPRRNGRMKPSRGADECKLQRPGNFAVRNVRPVGVYKYTWPARWLSCGRARSCSGDIGDCKLHAPAPPQARYSQRGGGTLLEVIFAQHRCLRAEVCAAYIDKEDVMKKFLKTTLGVALALGSTGIVFAAEDMSTSPEKSSQPGTDTWITTKVKAELATTKGISSNDISVTTKNGIVTLSGVVDSKAQVQKSVAVAKAVKGVHSVDSSALSSKD